MVLINISIGLSILGIIFFVIGLVLKHKSLKCISIGIFTFVILFWIGFFIWAIYDSATEYERRFGNDYSKTSESTQSDNVEDITDNFFNGKNGVITKIEDNNIYFKSQDDKDYRIKNLQEIQYINARTAEKMTFNDIKEGDYIATDEKQQCKIYRNILGEELKQELLTSLALPDEIDMFRTQIEGIKDVEIIGNNEAIVTVSIYDNNYFNINHKENKFDVKFKATNNTKYNTEFHGDITYNADTIQKGNSYMIYLRLNKATLNKEYPEITIFDAYSN